MENNNIIKELREIDRETFTALNSVFGYDFEKPFTTAEINGSFTINKIWKEISKEHSWNDSVVVALMVADDTCRWRQHTITQIKSDNINIDYRLYSTQSKVWEVFFAKGDFHDVRKKCKKVYIIAQKKEHMNEIKKETEHDLTGRFIANNNRVSRFVKSCGDKESYISSVGLIDPEHNGKMFDYKPSYSYNNPYRELSEIIDKSGYIVNNKRDNLKRRAEQLRKDRKAAAFRETDNTAVIKGLSEQLTALKKSICEQLALATTAQQIKVIEKSLSWYKGLGDCFETLEYIKQHDADKTFSSIGSFNDSVNGLKQKMEKVREGVA